MAGRTRRRALVWRAPTAIRLVAATATATTALTLTALPTTAHADTSIQGEQASIVTANFQGPLLAARQAVDQFTAATQRDAAGVAAARAAQSTADAIAAAAAARLGGDQAKLAAAVTALHAAEHQLAADRDQLRAIAVGMYSGALTNPQPASIQQLEAEQQQVIDAAEVGVVAGVVEHHVRDDLATTKTDSRIRTADANQVQADQRTQIVEAAAAQAAAARTTTDSVALYADQGQLNNAYGQLNSVEGELGGALQAIAGPSYTPAGQLSVIGGSALNATQLATWFNASGYANLTSASTGQLANWYIEAGNAEGVRGDVAFAQAVLETGGFSSPDAVNYSNFAGIGHCDACSTGWAFPSPQGGVLGQIQLLRIFADAGPAPPGAPGPVLPSLVPSQEMSAGCCSTIESLTGVWATDPTYGQQILDIYSQMLNFALSSIPPA